MPRKRYTEAQAKSAKKYLAQFAEIKLRITPEEKKILLEQADKAGKSVNQYLKDLILRKEGTINDSNQSPY